MSTTGRWGTICLRNRSFDTSCRATLEEHGGEVKNGPLFLMILLKDIAQCVIIKCVFQSASMSNTEPVGVPGLDRCHTLLLPHSTNFLMARRSIARIFSEIVVNHIIVILARR
jgi:hypothetical protein